MILHNNNEEKLLKNCAISEQMKYLFFAFSFEFSYIFGNNLGL